MILSRIIIKHRKECFMRGKNNPWSGLIDGYYWGNYAANVSEKQSNDHVWYKVTCNDPNCPAIKAVHSSILKNA